MTGFRRVATPGTASLVLLVVALALVGMLARSLVEASNNTPAPTGLTAAVTADGIDLSWTAPVVAQGEDNSSSYTIQVREVVLDNVGDWTTVATGVSGTTYRSTRMLYTELIYQFSVIAVYGTASSSASNTASVTAPAVPKPQGLTQTRTSEGIELSWRAPTLSWTSIALTLTGYVIERQSWPNEVAPGEGLTITYEELDPLDSDTTSYTDDTATRDRTYAHAVYAVYTYVRSASEEGEFEFHVGVADPQ